MASTTANQEGQIKPTSGFSTFDAAGLTCGPALSGSGTRLYQSGGDNGAINEINTSTRGLVQKHTSLIDEPYGMDMDGSVLYVVNKDDDNVVKITSSNSSSFGELNRLDDPRDVVIGLLYFTNTSSLSGLSCFMNPRANNEEPEFSSTLWETIISDTTSFASTQILNVSATDPENHSMAILVPDKSLLDGLIPIVNNSGGTVTISINPENAGADKYAFWFRVVDTHHNYTLELFMEGAS